MSEGSSGICLWRNNQPPAPKRNSDHEKTKIHLPSWLTRKVENIIKENPTTIATRKMLVASAVYSATITPNEITRNSRANVVSK